MTTIEEAHDTSATDPPTSRRGHIGRLTAFSMTAGAATALILTLGPFGGTTEPVITGVALLAFAASWALLATLSARRTDQPQRWAWVPALLMAAGGLLSLAVRPGIDSMRVAGWVWPIALVALAVWMVVQARRSMRSWARRVVLYPIFALMVAGGLGAAYETVRETQDRSTHVMPGELVDVGGHRLHIDCTGTGSPTVVLEAGLGASSPIMAGWIAPAVAPTTRVCVYDRAGKGWSDPAPEGQDGVAVVSDLHTLLERHGETGPFVIAGHSSGGVYGQAFAATYPDEIAGLVLIDSQPASALTRLPGYDQMYSWLRRASGIGPSVSRFGLMRLVITATAGSLPEPQRSEEDAFESSADQARSTREELEALPAAMERARGLTTLGDKPVAVVTAEKEAQKGWLPLQDEMTALSTNSVHHVIHDATHSSLVEDQTDAGNSSGAILDVVAAVRTHAAVAPATQGALTPVARPSRPVDVLVAVRGAQMHVRCVGNGEATVLLISGFETSGEIWGSVMPAVSERSRVCTYDRFGTGTSGPPPETQTFASQADDLRDALRSMNEPGPFVVVGHSFGGSQAVTFSAAYPDDVRGLVLLDASPTTWQSASCAVPDDGSPSAQGFRQVCAMTSSPANNAEHLDGPAAFGQVATIDSLGSVPMIVITAAAHPWGLGPEQHDRLDEVWHAGQAHWVSLSSSARFMSVEGTGHNIQVDRPDVVIQQIGELLP